MAKFKTASTKCLYILLLVKFHLPSYFFLTGYRYCNCFIYLVPPGDRRLGPGGSIKCSSWWEINHCIYSNFYSKFSNLNKINVCKVKNVYGCEKNKKTKTLIVSCITSLSTVKKIDKSNKNTVRINRTYSIVPMFLY